MDLYDELYDSMINILVLFFCFQKSLLDLLLHTGLIQTAFPSFLCTKYYTIYVLCAHSVGFW